MTPRLIFDSLISLIISSLPHNRTAKYWKKHQIRGSEGLFSCVSFYPIYFRTATAFSFSLWCDLCGMLNEHGEINTRLLLSGRSAGKIKLLRGDRRFCLFFPGRWKSLVWNPFISSQKATLVVQVNHRKWRKNQAKWSTAAQPLKIWVDYMLRFPGLLAYAQLGCKTASWSTEVAVKPDLQPVFTQLNNWNKWKYNAGGIWTSFAAYPDSNTSMNVFL